VVHRFGEEIERAQLHGADRVLHLSDRGHHQHDGLVKTFLVGIVEIEAVAVRQRQVEQHDVGPVLAEIDGGRGETLGGADAVADLLQSLLERPAEQFFIFDNQDLGHRSFLE
jgi:hypothetical protein